MRRTLFYLPHEIFGVPLFGVGWVLLLWTAISLGLLAVSIRRRGWDRDTVGQLPLTLFVALVVVFVIPRIEERIIEPTWVFPPVDVTTGLPIRGYGVMLLIGVVLGVALACQRAARAGLSPDVIMNLAFVIAISGILGARVFFVIQYWSTLQADTWSGTIGNLVSIDKGGLVVYGSLIGGTIGFIVFASRNQLPILPLADLIAPSLALGLAVGRIGCLMNGCCFGGPCELSWAVTFPAGSPPYADQQSWGQLHGFRLSSSAEGRPVIAEIDPDGPFANIPIGSEVVSIDAHPVRDLEEARYQLEAAGAVLQLGTADGKNHVGRLPSLPARSHPIHPTQVYSSVNGLLLCGLGLLVYPRRRRHGQVIALLLTLYAVTRFLLESIRTDEGEFLGRLTISQNISVVVGGCMIALWIYVYRQSAIPMTGLQGKNTS